jgi:hypothetical protein
VLPTSALPDASPPSPMAELYPRDVRTPSAARLPCALPGRRTRDPPTSSPGNRPRPANPDGRPARPVNPVPACHCGSLLRVSPAGQRHHPIAGGPLIAVRANLCPCHPYVSPHASSRALISPQRRPVPHLPHRLVSLQVRERRPRLWAACLALLCVFGWQEVQSCHQLAGRRRRAEWEGQTYPQVPSLLGWAIEFGLLAMCTRQSMGAEWARQGRFGGAQPGCVPGRGHCRQGRGLQELLGQKLERCPPRQHPSPAQAQAPELWQGRGDS